MAIILEPMSFIGLDLGQTQARVIQLNHSTPVPTLVAAGSLALNGNILAEDATNDSLLKTSEKIKQLISEVGIVTENVVCALPESEVFTRIIDIPKMPKDELAQAIQFEAESYIPYPLEEVQLDWQILEEGEDKPSKDNTHALLVAAPLKTIDRLIRVIEHAGLKPVAIETTAIAVNRSLTNENPLHMCVALLDMGAHASELSISDKGTIRLTHNIPIGSQSFTQAIQKELSLDDKEAEKLKSGLGKLDEVEKESVSKAYKSTLEAIATDVKRSLDFYRSQPHSNQINELILTGRGAQLHNLAAFLADHLTLKVTQGNPWLHIESKETLSDKQQTEMAPMFAVAVGLAMRKKI
ncbi:MAG TPA: type IV pilus assembly protein PilM [bacterium]|nr:type IV pilus assembly protein PilM [bacterium]